MTLSSAPAGVPRRDEVGALIQTGARLVLSTLDERLLELAAAHLQASGMEQVSADPVLAEASIRAIRSTVAHWAAAVVNQPFAPVGPPDDPDSLRIARDLVRRGLEDTALVAHRVVQATAWQAWISIAFTLSDDPELVRSVLEHTSASISDFVDRSLAHTSSIMASEREQLLRGSRPERRAMVELLLDGAPVAQEQASAALGLRLDRPHTAIVVWVDDTLPPSGALERAVDLVLRSSGRAHVSVLPQTGLAWLWVAGGAPDGGALERELRRWPDIHVAIGDTATGTDGFRQSHRSAVSVQRLLGRSRLRQVATADEARLGALLARNQDDATAFARTVLGGLTEAGPEVLDTVRAYVRELGNVTRVAKVVFAHRNTVIRRLARADELLPRPLRSNPVEVAVALEVWQWSGPHGPTAGP